VKPEINAICTVMIAVAAVAVVIASLLTKRASATGGSGSRAGY
jgi:ABC-type spermidine/putrescine transport system permease subunit II